MFGNQCKRPLLQPKPGAFLDPDFGTLGGAAEGSEDRHLAIERQAVIAPVPRRHHSPVEVEDSLKFKPVERDHGLPVPGRRERRDDAQALLAVGAGVICARSWRTSSASAATCASSSAARIWAGSTVSPHGVP